MRTWTKRGLIAGGFMAGLVLLMAVAGTLGEAFEWADNED